MKDTRLMTNSSRIGSIGGLVTCAKFLFEVSVEQVLAIGEREIGVSVPIEPTASWPVTAIGRTSRSRSSCV